MSRRWKPAPPAGAGALRNARRAAGALALALALVSAGALAGCGGAAERTGEGAAARPRAGTMSAADAKAFIASHPEALLLDVREPSEWNDDVGHIEGARLVPMGQLTAALPELAAWKDKPVIVICRVGVRSQRAAQMLAAQGFAQAWNLSGGMVAWRRAGH